MYIMKRYNVDYLLLILNCKKYRDKAITQKNTWLKKLPSNIQYFHIIGDKDKCNNDDIHIDFDEHIIYSNTLDDYNSLPSKVITTLKGVNNLFNYKYIFKTDDDQILIKEQFFLTFPKLLENYESKSHYGGFTIDCKEHISHYYQIHNCLPRNILLKATIYANGRFYYLSNSAVANLITKKSSIEKHYIEDHAIGLYLDPQFKENIIHFKTHDIFFDGTTHYEY